MQRAERDLVCACLTTLDAAPDVAAFAEAVAGLRQHSTPLPPGPRAATTLSTCSAPATPRPPTGEARGIAERLCCRPLLDRADTTQPAIPLIAPS
jgi:hypothetical protein